MAEINSIINDDKLRIESLLNLMIDVFNFEYVNVHLHLLKNNNLIITSKEIDKKRILKLCYATYIVVEKNTIPIDLNDLIIGVKNKLKKNIIF